jgi:hypothetical protein
VRKPPTEETELGMDFGPMTVEVGFVIEGDPTDEYIRCLQHDAERLTDDRSSVEVRVEQTGDRSRLVTTFSMPRTAQYKVVSDIAFRFTKMGFGCEHVYLDTWISFPRHRRSRRWRRAR